MNGWFRSSFSVAPVIHSPRSTSIPQFSQSLVMLVGEYTMRCHKDRTYNVRELPCNAEREHVLIFSLVAIRDPFPSSLSLSLFFVSPSLCACLVHPSDV